MTGGTTCSSRTARCCAGANSTYNIRMGRREEGDRARSSTTWASTCCRAAASCSLGSSGRYVGPGHFGLLDLGEGVQKFSCHYEADLDRGGVSVLDIRPLLWRDGWPVAGDNVTAGTYEIESARTGTALELAVQGSPSAASARRPRRRRAGRSATRSGARHPGRAPPDAGAARRRRRLQRRSRRRRPRRCRRTGRQGRSTSRLAPYMLQAQQKWTITPVAERRRLSRIAVLQDHHCRHGPRAGGDGGCASSWSLPAFTGGARAAVADRSAHRRQLSPDAQGACRTARSRWRSRPSAAARRRSRSSPPSSDRQRWLLRTP